MYVEQEKIKIFQDIQERNENKLKGKMLEKEFQEEEEGDKVEE